MNVHIEHWAARHCRSLRGAEHAISPVLCREHIEALPGWSLSAQAERIGKDFKFEDFHRTMAFVNAVAFIAHQEDHHPDMQIGFNHCHIYYSTHDVGGLSENDFICAAKIEKLVAQ